MRKSSANESSMLGNGYIIVFTRSCERKITVTVLQQITKIMESQPRYDVAIL